MEKIIQLLSQLPHHQNIDLDKLRSVLEPYTNNEFYLEQVEQVISSEINQAHFDPDHSKLRNRIFGFNHELSNLVSRILGIVFPMNDFKELIDPCIPYEETRINSAVNALKNDGYWICDVTLDEKKIDSIIQAIGSLKFVQKNHSGKIDGYKESNIYSIKDNTAWIRDQQDFLRIPEVQDLATDKTLLTIVQNYLETTPIHCQANCWWTIGKKYSESSLSSSAQLFHQDKEYIKFIKVFVYLNDVDEKNGPHKYIAGSHKDYAKNVYDGYKFGDRIPDDFLSEKYNADQFITIKGKKGTILFEDTSGFHKGEPALEGHRLLLQLEYCCSLYLNPMDSFSFEGLTPSYAKLNSSYPRIFSNYNDEIYRQQRRRQAKLEKNRGIRNLKTKVKRLVKKGLKLDKKVVSKHAKT